MSAHSLVGHRVGPYQVSRLRALIIGFIAAAVVIAAGGAAVLLT